MDFKILHQPASVNEECVVVIDVLRAFTTQAYAFANGAKEIVPVSTIDEAFAFRRQHPSVLLLGEIEGKPIEGFDLGNSPSQVLTTNLDGKTLVHRTSAGTQGVMRSLTSKTIFVASFVVCHATIEAVKQLDPSKVTFLVTGKNDGDEDLALADYMIATLRNQTTDPVQYLKRVKLSPAGRLFQDEVAPWFPRTDLELALHLDKFNFAMKVHKTPQGPVIRTTENFDLRDIHEK